MTNITLPKINFTPITEISEYFSERSALIDKAELTVNEGLAFLFGTDPVMTDQLGNLSDIKTSLNKTRKVAQAIASVAYEDMTSAFCSWAHRMVLEYLHQTQYPNDFINSFISELREVSLLGSTALGPGTANFLIGTPIPVTATESTESVIINGQIRWASNLVGNFIVVTAATISETEETILVAIPGGTSGLEPNKYMDLLGLQQTFSTSINISNLKVDESLIINRNFKNFMQTILPVFLILQSSFCQGLAARSLEESEPLLKGQSIVLADDHIQFVDTFNNLTSRMNDDSYSKLDIDEIIRELLQIRLEFAQLAISAVNLELKLQGGRAYATSSASSRRFREAAFLPIQAPTEVQLKWILSQLK